MGRSWEVRIAEYVDSPKLACRIKVGKVISCAVAGNYGTYHTRANLKETWDASCSCPYDGGRCKHILALEETYRKKPRSFVDVDRFLQRLSRRPITEILGLMRDMMGAHPQALDVLKIKGFRYLPERDEDERDDW